MLVNAGDTRDVGLIPGQEVQLVEGIKIHSSVLVWRILWTESLPGYGPQGCKESDTTEET